MSNGNHRIAGANLDRIEQLSATLDYRTPNWLPHSRDLHYSGLLRECSRFEYIVDGEIEDESGQMHRVDELLEEAAERLDMAHEAWLVKEYNEAFPSMHDLAKRRYKENLEVIAEAARDLKEMMEELNDKKDPDSNADIARIERALSEMNL